MDPKLIQILSTVVGRAALSARFVHGTRIQRDS